jgi:hypothetical protein
MEDKYRALCEHFGLNFDPDMKRRYEAWKSKRNPISHGRFQMRDSDFESQSSLFRVSVS